MLTLNQKIKAIWTYLDKKISKAWIRGNLVRYLAIYEVRESGMIIPFQEESQPSSPDLLGVQKVDIENETTEISTNEEVEFVPRLITVDDVLRHLKTVPYSENKETTVSSVEVPEEDTKYGGGQISKINISFAKTSQELLGGNKTQTRQVWSDLYAKRVENACRKGELITAKNANGQTLAFLKIKNMYKQQLAEMTYADVAAEGFDGFSPMDFINQFFNGDKFLTVWVVEFKIVENFSEEIKEKEYEKICEKGFVTPAAFRTEIQEGVKEIAKENLRNPEVISDEEFAEKREVFLAKVANLFGSKNTDNTSEEIYFRGRYYQQLTLF